MSVTGILVSVIAVIGLVLAARAVRNSTKAVEDERDRKVQHAKARAQKTWEELTQNTNIRGLRNRLEHDQWAPSYFDHR